MEKEENKVILDKNGDIEILLTGESRKSGYVSIEEAKRLIAQIIKL
jgi:hypothetical protein